MSIVLKCKDCGAEHGDYNDGRAYVAFINAHRDCGKPAPITTGKVYLWRGNHGIFTRHDSAMDNLPGPIGDATVIDLDAYFAEHDPERVDVWELIAAGYRIWPDCNGARWFWTASDNEPRYAPSSRDAHRHASAHYLNSSAAGEGSAQRGD